MVQLSRTLIKYTNTRVYFLVKWAKDSDLGLSVSSNTGPLHSIPVLVVHWVGDNYQAYQHFAYQEPTNCTDSLFNESLRWYLFQQHRRISKVFMWFTYQASNLMTAPHLFLDRHMCFNYSVCCHDKYSISGVHSYYIAIDVTGNPFYCIPWLTQALVTWHTAWELPLVSIIYAQARAMG